MRQRLINQNIKGTPSMKAEWVRADLHVVKARNPTIVAFQEMKWSWYWVALLLVFPPIRWGRFPLAFASKVSTTAAKSAQPIVWDRKAVKKIEARQRPLHDGIAGQTEDRYLNAVLFEDRSNGARFWVKCTHYLPRRADAYETVWPKANERDRAFTDELLRTGYPVISVGDYNDVGPSLGEHRGGRKVQYECGTRNHIEKLMVVNGDSYVITDGDCGVIGLAELHTDHPGRVYLFNVVPRQNLK